MKRYFLIMLVLLCTISLNSCKDFLSITPRNTKIVSTVEDYRDIMASYMTLVKTANPDFTKVYGAFGEGFNYPTFDVSDVISVYTGESVLAKTATYYDADNSLNTAVGKSIATWSRVNWEMWDSYYKFLGSINLVVSGIEKAKGDDENLRNYVQGEALVWRAYSYFKLLQYYAPYKSKELGIPVQLDPVTDIVNVKPQRKAQPEVYSQIIKDLNASLELLKVTKSGSWNLYYDKQFVMGMLASIYTYKAMSGAAETTDWANAETYAVEAMKGRRLESTASALKKVFDGSGLAIASAATYKNDEFSIRIVDGVNGDLFKFGRSYYKSTSGTSDGTVNSDFYQLYSDSDIRKGIYFSADGASNNKYNLGTAAGSRGYGMIIPFRLAEMYLIKAEAQFRQGKTGEAKLTLREFKQARYTDPQADPSDSNLLEEIFKEREREFYIENDFIWLDYKRRGVQLERIVDGEKFTLHADDFRYAFPIPISEINNNRDIVQNPGWERFIQ